MSRIVVTEFVSLDGVMQAPGGDDDFVRGAWTFEYERSDAATEFKATETFDSDALLLGRKTYDGFAAAWPERSGDPFSDKFNAMPKFVISSTLSDPEWNNTTVFAPPLEDAVAQVKDRVPGYALVHGSCQLVQTLLAADLVDELRLMTFPVILGTGKKLFGDTSESKKFKLEELNDVGDGVTTAVYRRA